MLCVCRIERYRSIEFWIQHTVQHRLYQFLIHRLRTGAVRSSARSLRCRQKRTSKATIGCNGRLIVYYLAVNKPARSTRDASITRVILSKMSFDEVLDLTAGTTPYRNVMTVCRLTCSQKVLYILVQRVGYRIESFDI